MYGQVWEYTCYSIQVGDTGQLWGVKSLLPSTVAGQSLISVLWHILGGVTDL